MGSLDAARGYLGFTSLAGGTLSTEGKKDMMKNTKTAFRS